MYADDWTWLLGKMHHICAYHLCMNVTEHCLRAVFKENTWRSLRVLL